MRMYFNVIEKLHNDDKYWLELNSREAHSVELFLKRQLTLKSLG
jgi:hypothetical protein